MIRGPSLILPSGETYWIWITIGWMSAGIRRVSSFCTRLERVQVIIFVFSDAPQGRFQCTGKVSTHLSAPSFSLGACLLSQPDLPTVPNDLSPSSGLGNSLRWRNLKGLATRYAKPTCRPKDFGDAR